jgi:tyrosyl-tRNA synthetase
MSKSVGNYIGINEPPEQQYGKVMSLPDQAILPYFRLVTRFEPERIAGLQADLEGGRLHPRDAKMQLAREVVSIFHGDEAAGRAEAHFRTVFQQRDMPPDIPEYSLKAPTSVVDLVRTAGLAPSKREARRLIEQGGVKMEGRTVASPDEIVHQGWSGVLQVGRRRFVRIVPTDSQGLGVS